MSSEAKQTENNSTPKDRLAKAHSPGIQIAKLPVVFSAVKSYHISVISFKHIRADISASVLIFFFM